MAQHYVYFIQNGDFCKIGRSSNVQKRLLQIRTSNPLKVELLKAFPVRHAELCEKALHRRLWEYRINGEWFRLPTWLIRAVMAQTDYGTLIRYINHRMRKEAEATGMRIRYMPNDLLID